MLINDKVDAVFIPDSPSRIKATDYNQIKNEIQECITEAGLTPTKDVIQLPQALKILTAQSGAEEVAKIEAAGQEQLDAINTAGAQAVQDAQDAANTATAKATEAAGSASAAASSASAASGSASTAATQASNAEASAELAQKWATQTTAEVVSGQGYGAKYYADQAAASATAASGSASTASTSAGEAANSASAAAQSAIDAANSAAAAKGLQIGSVYFSQSNLATDNPGALPLWTGEYYSNASSLYPDFYNWVKSHTELCKTKTEYDTAISTYGECPYYVVDEVEGSLRLPKLVNYLKMANATDGITQKGAGLPDHDHTMHAKGTFSGFYFTNTNSTFSGGGSSAFGGGTVVNTDLRTGDASQSNAVYGASNTVQPAHTTLYPWIIVNSKTVSPSQYVLLSQIGTANGVASLDADTKVPMAQIPSEVTDNLDLDFDPSAYNWPDIRPAARPNAIVLLAGVKADYSAYDNLGFVATCEGGYNVFIDGVQYGETYASDAQCSITWSQYSATAGFSVSYPEALTAHIVQIVPAGKNDITAFRGARIAASGEENQGRLWIHFNLTNTISLQYLCARYNNFKNPLFVAITSNSKFIKVSNIEYMLGETTDLHARYSPCEFLPGFDLSESQSVMAAGAFNTNGVPVIRLKNGILHALNAAFANNTHLKKIELDNVTLKTSITGFPYYDISNIFKNCEKLEELPPIDMSGCYQFDNFITNCQSLKDFILDWGYANLLKHISFGGNSSAPIWALKGLLLSPCAPFDGTSPQIDVSYTGLDQNALAALFKSLPYNVGYSVTGSPTIQDGIVTNADSANSVMLPMFDFFTAESFDYVVKLKTGGSGGPNGTFSSFPMENTATGTKAMYGIYKYGDTLSLYGGFDAENNMIQTSIPFTANSALYVRWQKASGHFKSSYSFDGSDWTTASNTTSTVMKNHTAIRITPDFSWTGSAVDLNGTYITVNGVPYFRGTAAMDKTINITGATGAAALTAEQLAIATDKGWTVTR